MKNRLYDCTCVLVLLAILQSSICHAKVVNDTRRTKREISIAETSRPKGDISAKQINLEREEKGDDPEEGDSYRDNTKEKRKISRKVTNSVISADFHPSNVEGSLDDDVSSYLNLRRSSEESEEADEEATERDKNEEASNLVRLRRDINGDLDRYTDQDARLSLYDDYEAKDVAKRGVLSGPEDYEEIEDDSPGISEDMAALQGSTNVAEMRETRKDARVKRDQAEISEMLDTSKSSPNNPAKLEESEGKNPYSRQVSRIGLSRGFNEASAPNDASKTKGFGSTDETVEVSKLSDFSKIQEPTSKITSSKKDELNAKYEKRVEEEIQRKIDSLKEEIQRDVEARQRVRAIEDNNARFDELQDQEHEDEERQNFKDEPIEKRQTVARRSVREVVDDTAGSSKKNKKERSSRRELHKKRQHQSSEIGKSDALKENGNLKRRFLANHEQIPSKGPFKKKRQHARQIFLMNNEQHQVKKRQSRSYILPSDQTAENELFMNPDLNSYSHTDNRMLQVSLPVGGEDENKEGEQSPTAEHSDSLVSLTGSSQELSPRLEKEYKEVFGGLQSESGSALARFKRIKRVLVAPNAKI